jgi:hypothetical protein
MRCSKHGKIVKKNSMCIDDLREALKRDPEYPRWFKRDAVD